MGIIKKLMSRRMTPEQLSERSRKEQEWADKCYRAGERVGEKLNLAKAVDNVNTFINRYPKTFFTVVGAILVVSMVGNLIGSGNTAAGIIEREASNMKSIRIPVDEGRDILQKEVAKHTQRMQELERQLDAYIGRDSLTHGDSVAIRDIAIEMKAIHDALGLRMELETNE